MGEISEKSDIFDIKTFQYDKRVTLIYFAKDFFKIIKVTGEMILKYDNFYLDLKMRINTASVIDGIYNHRPRVVIGFKNGEILKVSSIYTTRLDHFQLLQKENIYVNYFPEFNEKLINQNEEYLIIWDIEKNCILQSKETKESNQIMYLDRADRNKNFKSFVYSKGSVINSRNIYYERKKWRITEGKKITPLYDLKYNTNQDVKITYLKRLEEYHCFHKDRILVGFSNGYISLYQFFNSSCLFQTKAHKKKINNILHLKEYNVNYFVSSGGNQIKVWNFATKELITELKGHLKKITDLQFLKYINIEYISSSSKDGNLIIWDFVQREKLLVLKIKNPIIFTLYIYDLNPSTFITVTRYNQIEIWQQKKK